MDLTAINNITDKISLNFDNNEFYLYSVKRCSIERIHRFE